MTKIIFISFLIAFLCAEAGAQLHLSRVNTGDCVAPRITAKRTLFVDEQDKKYCNENNADKAKAAKCLQNSRSDNEFSFFTDRCSESDSYIGINGKEVQLKRISKKPGKPNNFIGSFAANGIKVEIGNARLISKTYFEGEPKDESNVQDAVYKVDVTVTKGSLTKTFKGVTFMYGL